METSGRPRLLRWIDVWHLEEIGCEWEVAQAGLQEPVIESKLCRSWLREDISQETILVAQVKVKNDVDRG